MHIQEGFLPSGPVCLATGAIAVGAFGYSLYRLRDALADRTIPMTGMVSALLFSGQMVNFPVGPGTSGHLIGGVLAARLLGPWGGCVALTLVLTVQRFLFADGGLTTLGANILHMAVVGAIGGHALMELIQRCLGRTLKAQITASVLASWMTVMIMATLCCFEFAFAWKEHTEFRLDRFLPLMFVFHAIIGVGEALITGSVVRFVGVRRPDLLYAPTETPTRPLRRFLLHGFLVALGLAVFLAPAASNLPDGLDRALLESAPDVPEPPVSSLFASYDALLPTEGWGVWSVILSGVIGTIAVVGISTLLGRAIVLGKSDTPEPSRD